MRYVEGSDDEIDLSRPTIGDVSVVVMSDGEEDWTGKFSEWCAANEDVALSDLRQLLNGGFMMFGGGAAALFEVAIVVKTKGR